jgi:ubiquinone biosynthesis protein COQ9
MMRQPFVRSIIGEGFLRRYFKSSQTIAAPTVVSADAAAIRPYLTVVPPCRGRNHFASSTVAPSSSLTAGQQHQQPHHIQRQLFSSYSSIHHERHKRLILTHALPHVHDDGWTDDAIASGTLDANLPPSYIGMMGDGLSSSSTLPLGNADLVAFFMEECNETLKLQLAAAAELEPIVSTASMTQDEYYNHISSRIYNAMHQRLSLVIPFVKSNRWHEGMAIGALPQNAIRTIQQLDTMANIVLDYALSSGSKMGGGETYSITRTPAQRTAIVAAYAAAELHLLSDGNDGTFSTFGGKSASSLRGEKESYRATWTFLEARSAEVARFIVDGGSAMLPNSLPSSLPQPAHVITAATSVASSLAGAALSLASPAAAAAVAGHVVPHTQNAMTSAFTFLENVVRSTTQQPAAMGGATASSTMRGNGTRPSDYTVETATLPPFDASEEIFGGGEGKSTVASKSKK